MQIVWNPSTDPAFNLALEECMTRELRGDILMLWQNAPAVIVGRNQNTYAEADMEYLRSHDIRLIRRMTGGGAVYHDAGNLNYSCMTDCGTDDFASFERFARPVTDTLAELGLHTEFSGRNDILLDGRKISGTAKCFLKERLLFHGTLLFDADMTILEKVLTPDPEKAKWKGIRSVRSRVANIREYHPGITPELFRNTLLKRAGKTEYDSIPPEILEQAEALAESKYRTWEWNYGSAPSYDFTVKKRFAGGSVRLGITIRQGCMEDIGITGDFFGEREVTELAGLLRGKQFRKDVIEEALSGIGTEKYISGVTKEEFFSLFDLTKAEKHDIVPDTTERQ